MSNIQIAEQYARQMSRILKTGGTWPHNLNRTRDAAAIVAVYKKYFSRVSYDSQRDICICVK